MTVIKVLCESTDGGAGGALWALKTNPYLEYISIPVKFAPLLASSWQRFRQSTCFQVSGPPGGMVPYRKLSFGLHYWKNGPSAVVLPMPTSINRCPYCGNPYSIPTAMTSFFMDPLSNHWDG